MSDKQKYVAYVGTYTQGSSLGIYIYDVDVKEGTLSERKYVPINNSSYLCRSANGKFLYSIEDEGVAVFAIEDDGDLKMINRIKIGGMRGCYVSVDHTGKYLFVAGYHDGKVTLIHTHHDGRLGSVMDGVFHKGLGSVSERNFRAHVSCVKMTPDNKYLCAVDNGIDQVKVYSISNKDKLELRDIIRCERESAPRLIKFGNSGKFAYILYELNNSVEVYSYKDNDGEPEFEKLQTISTTSENVDEIHDAASGMDMSPDGKFLFTSTAGDDTVAMFAIDQKTGLLTKKFALPIGGVYPKDIAVFPDGKHIACVNHESGTITTFTIDYDKNVLIQKGRPCTVDTPNCILITPMGCSKS
ncbi:MAG: lactonase family protein [Lachnospiraceae bacterium]|jgi:6-phosphogluconolactonase|nr:lactonase family protein [Lachnospiraceae bacterium]